MASTQTSPASTTKATSVTVNVAFLREIKEVHTELWDGLMQLEILCSRPISLRSQSDELVERLSLDADVIADSPFVLCGTVEQIVDKIGRLREQLGISHYVVRDAEGFAPVMEALTTEELP